MLKCYFTKAIDHTFYGFTDVMTHLGRGMLRTSRVGYNAGKLVKSVVYGLNKTAGVIEPAIN